MAEFGLKHLPAKEKVPKGPKGSNPLRSVKDVKIMIVFFCSECGDSEEFREPRITKWDYMCLDCALPF